MSSVARMIGEFWDLYIDGAAIILGKPWIHESKETAHKEWAWASLDVDLRCPEEWDKESIRIASELVKDDHKAIVIDKRTIKEFGKRDDKDLEWVIRHCYSNGKHLLSDYLECNKRKRREEYDLEMWNEKVRELEESGKAHVRTFRVFSSGEAKRESCCRDWSNEERGIRMLKSLCSDKTGNTESVVVTIVRNTSEEIYDELWGQLNDGMFEENGYTRVTELVDLPYWIDGVETEARAKS